MLIICASEEALTPWSLPPSVPPSPMKCLAVPITPSEPMPWRLWPCRPRIAS
jgi:hypothetical protein